MTRIEYREIDDALAARLIAKYPWVQAYECLPRGPRRCAVAALAGDEIVGFLAAEPQRWIPPLDDMEDAFIEVIEVDAGYRRHGIGREMVSRAEEWARAEGLRQIRSWSSDDKATALRMWVSLGYCMCPAAMLGESVAPGFEGKKIIGYYYAKLLREGEG